MLGKRVERVIDEALLHTATLSGVLYVQRRTRRALPKIAVGTAVLAGLGAAAATAAAGVGAVGLAGGAAAWYRHRERQRSIPADAGPATPAVKPSSSSYVATDDKPEPAATFR